METTFLPCGNSDNTCKCKNASECGYTAKQPMETWEEAKDKIAFKHGGHSSWIEMRRFFDSQSPYLIEQRLGEAAELYASSRVRALEVELAKVKEEIIPDMGWISDKDPMAKQKLEAQREFHGKLKRFEEENKRLQERLEAAEKTVLCYECRGSCKITDITRPSFSQVVELKCPVCLGHGKYSL